MRPRLGGWVAVACSLAWEGTLQAQSTAAPSRALTISGYIEASSSYSSNHSGSIIVGRLYDRFHNQAELNALTLVLDHPYQPQSMTAGIHAELLFGQNATVIKSAGFQLGDQGDVPQLYGTLNIPTADGNGFQIKVGRMPTLLGLEVIETTANPNWSEGNQFIYLENFTQTGLSLEHKFSDRLDAQLRVFNGWDVVEDNNTRKSFMARVGLAPASNVQVALLGYFGPEQPGNSTANRYGGEALVGSKLGKTSVWLQGDWGGEEANSALPDPSRAAAWWGLGCWVSHDLSSKLVLAFRGDYMNDEDGARTSGVLGFPGNTGQKVGSVTATLNVRSWEGLLLRPELRYDRSSFAPYGGKRDQVTFALSTAYQF